MSMQNDYTGWVVGMEVYYVLECTYWKSKCKSSDLVF